jgi:flagellar biosynthesis protein FliQ
VASVLAVLVLTGPAITAMVVEYTRNSLLAIEHVVR